MAPCAWAPYAAESSVRHNAGGPARSTPSHPSVSHTAPPSFHRSPITSRPAPLVGGAVGGSSSPTRGNATFFNRLLGTYALECALEAREITQIHIGIVVKVKGLALLSVGLNHACRPVLEVGRTDNLIAIVVADTGLVGTHIDPAAEDPGMSVEIDRPGLG